MSQAPFAPFPLSALSLADQAYHVVCHVVRNDLAQVRVLASAVVSAGQMELYFFEGKDIYATGGFFVTRHFYYVLDFFGT